MGIEVLGPLTIDGNGSLSPRDRVVLTALVTRLGQPTSSEMLAEALWPDRPPASWGKVVPGCINRLRKRLGASAITTSGGGYALLVEIEEIDAARFERLVGKGHQLLALGEPDRAILAFREGLALWRGPALQEAEEWAPARTEAERLGELRLEAEEAVLDASLRVGLQAGILAEARSRVAQAPVRERRWAMLALAQYLAGSQVDALSTLRQCRAMLSRELGLDPGPELVSLEQRILRQDPALTAATALPRPAARCPYPGLRPYDVGDSEFFFGRDADLRVCLARLREEGALVLVGASGSGKSSLIRAGVVAALTREGRQVEIPPPGTSPADLVAGLEGGTGVLVVDQLEEVVAQCETAEELRRFGAALVATADRRPLVVVVRADRFGDVSGLPGFGRLAERALHVLSPLGDAELQLAIEGPAREAALLLESGLVDLLLRDLQGEPGALPLLSHALRETWERREGRTLTVEGYRASGGIRGAVGRSAEEVYAGLPKAGRHTLRDLMLRLLTVAPDGEPVRCAVRRGSVPADQAHQQLVEQLVRARLLTVDAEVLTLAHETLARAWPRLRGWLDDDREGQQILRHLTAAAESWAGMGRPDSELYRGSRLASARDWHRRSGAELTTAEADFLDRSEQVGAEAAALERAEDSRRRRTRRRVIGLVATATALAVVAGGAAIVAVRQQDRAATERLAASANRAVALAHSEDAPDHALLLALEAVRRADSPETRLTLLETLTRSPELVRVIPTDGFGSVDIGPDGRVALADGTLRILRDATGPVESEHRDDYWGAFWLPDGGMVSVGPEGPALHGEPGAAGTPLAMPVRWAGLFTVGLTINSAATHVAVALVGEAPDQTREQTTLVVWDLSRPGEPVTLAVVPGVGPALALSRDGRRLFSLHGETPVLEVYSVAERRLVASRPLSRKAYLPAWSRQLAMSPDGSLLAAQVGPDVLLVDPDSLTTVRRLGGHIAAIHSVEFSPGGRLVAAGASDGSILVWDTLTGAVEHRLAGPTALIRELSFAPDGRTLVSGTDQGLLVWDLSGERRFVSRSLAPGASTYHLSVVAPDGSAAAFFNSTVATLARDRDFVLLQIPSGVRRSVAAGYSNWGAFSPAGDRLATAVGRTVQVWDAESGDQVARARLPGGHTEALTWSGDGRWLVAATREGMIRALDEQTLAPVGKPVDLPAEVMDVLPVPGTTSVVVLTLAASYWLVDVETGEVRAGLTFDELATYGAVSPDGQRLAVSLGGEGAIGLVSLGDGTWLSEPRRGHSNLLTRVDFSGDGSTFVSVGLDGRVILWDGHSGSQLASIRPGGPDTSLGVTFLSDGHTLQVVTSLGEVFRWDTLPEAWVERACRMAGRNLTQAEWQEAFGDDPWLPTCPGPSPPGSVG